MYAEHAITAREIFEISPASQGRFSITVCQVPLSDIRPTPSFYGTLTFFSVKSRPHHPPHRPPPPRLRLPPSINFLHHHGRPARSSSSTDSPTPRGSCMSATMWWSTADRYVFLCARHLHHMASPLLTPAAAQEPTLLFNHQTVRSSACPRAHRDCQKVKSNRARPQRERWTWLHKIQCPQGRYHHPCFAPMCLSPSEHDLMRIPQIPDLPPTTSMWPEGTDESERIMPGQEFIPVEAIFTASSDGLTCVIERIAQD